ncbi:hypothetical protein [Mesorhizobium sp. dw_380]|uniref:hypothetical protein n=1 Tax=Mesorhizobium sp. dw_380 TaxID=2812001 RepID=UPI001BDED28B|nr:hypothetical protein [Mesorhizobium sp. dw_380]
MNLIAPQRSPASGIEHEQDEHERQGAVADFMSEAARSFAQATSSSALSGDEMAVADILQQIEHPRLHRTENRFTLFLELL